MGAYSFGFIISCFLFVLAYRNLLQHRMLLNLLLFLSFIEFLWGLKLVWEEAATESGHQFEVAQLSPFIFLCCFFVTKRIYKGSLFTVLIPLFIALIVPYFLNDFLVHF